jgi:hypothetical protein
LTSAASSSIGRRAAPTKRRSARERCRPTRTDWRRASAPPGRLTEPFAAFLGQLALAWRFLEAGGAEAKGIVERLVDDANEEAAEGGATDRRAKHEYVVRTNRMRRPGMNVRKPVTGIAAAPLFAAGLCWSGSDSQAVGLTATLGAAQEVPKRRA